MNALVPAFSGGTALDFYEAACTAIAQAVTLDAAKDIVDRAAAAGVYARQIKNRSVEIDAVEIRVRAERRLGILITDLKRRGIYPLRGNGPQPKRGRHAGVDTAWASRLNLAYWQTARCQFLARSDEKSFEAEIAAWRQRAVLQTKGRLFRPQMLHRADYVRKPGNWREVVHLMDGSAVAQLAFGELAARRDQALAEAAFLDSLLAGGQPISSAEAVGDYYTTEKLRSLFIEAGGKAGMNWSGSRPVHPKGAPRNG